VRKIASIAVFGVLLVSISACSTPGSASASCDVKSSAELVTADGAFGADPEASFPTPLIEPESGVTELIAGDGNHVPAGGVVQGTVSVYAGETGDPVVSGGPLVGVPILFPTSNFILPFTSALACGSNGSRLVATGSAADMLGADAAEQQFQLDPDASVVVVADITTSYIGKADGVDQLAQSGMPAIVLAPNGQPGFTFPDSAPPTELTVDLLKKGAGATAKADDALVVQFSAINWGEDTLLQSTWVDNSGSPTAVPLGSGDSNGIFTADIKKALVGQTVGSQLLIAVPGDQTVVYVIDILGIAE
jgi:peptidylprolyl isomerase